MEGYKTASFTLWMHASWLEWALVVSTARVVFRMLTRWFFSKIPLWTLFSVVSSLKFQFCQMYTGNFWVICVWMAEACLVVLSVAISHNAYLNCFKRVYCFEFHSFKLWRSSGRVSFRKSLSKWSFMNICDAGLKVASRLLCNQNIILGSWHGSQ